MDNLTSFIILNNPLEYQSFFHNRILANPFISFSKLIIVISTAILIWLRLSFIKTERINAFEYIDGACIDLLSNEEDVKKFFHNSLS